MKVLILVFVVLFLLLQYQLWVGEGSLSEVSALKQQIEQQKQHNTELKTRNLALQEQVKDLKQGLDAIEEYARSELGMIRQGETFYQIINQPTASASTQAAP